MKRWMPMALAVAGLGLTGCAAGRTGPAPDFTLPDLQGHDVSLSDFKGKPVLLVFWAVG